LAGSQASLENLSYSQGYLCREQLLPPMSKMNILLGWVPGVHKNSNNSSYGTLSK
jgi:hypothetical protein